jgi:hypothetical protein
VQLSELAPDITKWNKRHGQAGILLCVELNPASAFGGGHDRRSGLDQIRIISSGPVNRGYWKACLMLKSIGKRKH